jgi:ribosomal protein S6--L-glutamate ligase
MMIKPRIALERRLRNCKNVITIGVRTNLADYEDWQIELIRQADVILYPTAFYADIFDTMGKRTFPNYHTYKYTMDKIKQTALFNLLDISHPKTRVFYGIENTESLSVSLCRQNPQGFGPGTRRIPNQQ